MNPNQEDCQKTVKPWMDLFDLFGTHFSYNIKIGKRENHCIVMALPTVIHVILYPMTI